MILNRWDDTTWYSNYYIYSNYCEEDTSTLRVNRSNFSFCYPCVYPCLTCKEGNGRGYCYSCGYGPQNRTAPYYHSYYGWNRNCDCKSGYYEED